MMMSEFIERVGFEPTAAEYAEIEQEYMGCDVDKDKFCKEWKKNGGIQRLCRMRARRIEELEAEVAMKDRQYAEMDARHSRQFNEMHSILKSELEAATKRLENVQNEKDCLYGEIQKAKAAQKEAEGSWQRLEKRSQFSELQRRYGMRKVYKKLTKEQKERGVIFSSCLSKCTTELVGDTIHEVMENDPDKNETIRRLKDDSFFRNSIWKYNIIRT